MAKLLDLQTFINDKGRLTVIEKILPFEIKRIFFIYGVDDSVRGKHRHRLTSQAAICMQGSCKIYNQSSQTNPEEVYFLNAPDKCLLLMPDDFHWMTSFTPDCILMVMASHFYSEEDYIFTPYYPISV